MYYVVYGMLYLFSLLPFWFMYVLSDLLYLLVYYIIGYRKKTVLSNLRTAFPEKSEQQRVRIAKQFYRLLTDYPLEVIKLLSISEKNFFKRCVGNFEVVRDVAAKGKNIQMHTGHQFNAEYGVRYYSAMSTIPMYGMYVRITNKLFNRLYLKMRTHYGLTLIEAAEFRNRIHSMYRGSYFLGWLADQNASNPRNAYWLNFLNKPAPFIRAAERSAVKNNVAVVFARVRRIKRGYYYFENILATENAGELAPGELTRRYRDFLEETIRLDPPNYLWTHRRWKHEFKKEYNDHWIDEHSLI
jgi:KDO2-lipid IV(A) lauroyltransferase